MGRINSLCPPGTLLEVKVKSVGTTQKLIGNPSIHVFKWKRRTKSVSTGMPNISLVWVVALQLSGGWRWWG
jgi:hypothetical protein